MIRHNLFRATALVLELLAGALWAGLSLIDFQTAVLRFPLEKRGLAGTLFSAQWSGWHTRRVLLEQTENLLLTVLALLHHVLLALNELF